MNPVIVGMWGGSAILLGIGFVLTITRSQLVSNLRIVENYDESEVAPLRERATRHNPAAGVAKDLLMAYEQPERIRRQMRILSAVIRTAFWCAAVLALIGAVLLAF